MNKKFASLGTAMSRDEAKRVMGGLEGNDDMFVLHAELKASVGQQQVVSLLPVIRAVLYAME